MLEVPPRQPTVALEVSRLLERYHLVHATVQFCILFPARRPCDLPLEVGQGVEKLERWFFDGGIQMCRPFVYKGMKGNSNNFLTKQSCRQSCKEMNPCGYGDPLVDTTGERMLCTGGQRVNSCPQNSYCHVGSSALTTLCCPKRSMREFHLLLDTYFIIEFRNRPV